MIALTCFTFTDGLCEAERRPVFVQFTVPTIWKVLTSETLCQIRGQECQAYDALRLVVVKRQTVSIKRYDSKVAYRAM